MREFEQDLRTTTRPCGRHRLAILVVATSMLFGACSTEPRDEGSSLPAIPGLGHDDGDRDDCDTDTVPLGPEEFAAMAHVWFHGVITDVYAVTDFGSTYALRSERGYGGELLTPLDECRFVTPRYRLRIEVLDFLGEEIPPVIHATVAEQWLTSRPDWNGEGVGGHDGFTWEGDRFAIGQHIGGNLSWSPRFELGRLQVNPSSPVFTVRDDGSIEFQEIDWEVGDFEEFCYAFDAREVITSLNGMEAKDFMDRMALLRDSENAPDSSQLAEIRRIGFNRVDWVNDDVAANSFFPTCTPSDYEREAR